MLFRSRKQADDRRFEALERDQIFVDALQNRDRGILRFVEFEAVFARVLANPAGDIQTVCGKRGMAVAMDRAGARVVVHLEIQRALVDGERGFLHRFGERWVRVTDHRNVLR